MERWRVLLIQMTCVRPLCNARGTTRYTRHCDEKNSVIFARQRVLPLSVKKSRHLLLVRDLAEIPALIVALSGGVGVRAFCLKATQRFSLGTRRASHYSAVSAFLPEALRARSRHCE